MSKKTIALIIGLLLVSIALVALAIIPSQQKTIQTTNPTPTIPPSPTTSPSQTILTLLPNPLTVATSSGEIFVNIETGSNKITAVQLELTFNPQDIAAINITPDSFMEGSVVLLKDIDLQTGTISYALGIAPNQEAKSGSGTVAKIEFTKTATAGTQTEIKFSPKTLVTAEGTTNSVLRQANGTTIQFPQVNGTRTSNPIATPTIQP